MNLIWNFERSSMNSITWFGSVLLVCLVLTSQTSSAQHREQQPANLDGGVDPASKQPAKIYTTEDCASCQPDKCTPVTSCNVGIVRDKCGCCDVCGLEEGHLCNIHDFQAELPWFGSCGVNLECRMRTDVDRSQVGNQSVCYCVKEGMVCGSDSKTYTECQMQAIEVQTNKVIHMISRGYCKTKPEIITIAEDQAVKEGSKASFLCEVKSFPLPSVSWFFTAPDTTEAVKLPGDSDEISVTFRGGPQPKRITSHLQITNFMLKNEGKYQCFADNDMGMDNKEFTLVLIA